MADLKVAEITCVSFGFEGLEDILIKSPVPNSNGDVVLKTMVFDRQADGTLVRADYCREGSVYVSVGYFASSIDVD